MTSQASRRHRTGHHQPRRRRRRHHLGRPGRRASSGVRHLDDDWAEELPVKIAGRDRRRADRGARAGQGPPPRPLLAVRDGRGHGGLGGLRPRRTPTSTTTGSASRWPPASAASPRCSTTTTCCKEKGPRRVSPLAVPMLMPNAPAANISLLRRRPGRGQHARSRPAPPATRRSRWRSTRSGSAAPTSSLAGGTEAAIHPLPMAAFANMMALSKNAGDPTTVSRPWDTGRDGFVLGEGAGVLVLESEEHAKARGATDLRRGARRRHHRRRPRHRPARPGRPRRRAGDPAGAGGVRDRAPPTSPTSTPTPPRRRRATSPRA